MLTFKKKENIKEDKITLWQNLSNTTRIPEMLGRFFEFENENKKTLKSHEPIFYSQ